MTPDRPVARRDLLGVTLPQRTTVLSATLAGHTGVAARRRPTGPELGGVGGIGEEPVEGRVVVGLS